MNRCSTGSLIVCWAVATVLGSGCGPAQPTLEPPGSVSADPEAEREFRAARASYEAGDLLGADSAFATFTREFPDDSLARSAIVFRGRIALDRGNPERARVLLAPVVGKQDPVAERASLYDGIALFELDKPDRAIERLAPFEGRLTDPRENRLLLACLWRAARELGDSSRAIRWLDVYLGTELPEQEAAAGAAGLRALADRIERREELEQLAEQIDPEGRAWPVVQARLVELSFEGGDLKGALSGLEEIRNAGHAGDPAVNEIAELVEERSAVNLTTVGCVLPISGRSRLVGEAVLKGVMLGARVLDLGGEGQPLEVVVKDSAGKPERARAAVEELVREEHVVGIVGPVDGAAARAAAEQADQLGVPIVLLSMKERVAAGKANAFRLFSSSRAEVEALVSAAIDQGGESFAIAYPKDGYGRGMLAVYEAVLAGRGLTLGQAVEYDPAQKSFAEPAEQLAEADFDVLFLPDRASRLVLLAPALAAAGIWSAPPGGEIGGPGRAVQYLVPSVGLSKEVPRRAGRYLQGALFASSYHPEATAGSARLAEVFASDYGRPPTHYGAFGHDAVLLMAAGLEQGVGSRRALRRWLAQATPELLGHLPLAAPFDGFDGDGEARGMSWLVTIDGDEIQVRR